MNLTVFEQLMLSLLLGLLVGLQRERAESSIAGIRTFPLITLLGTVCALLGGWVIGAGLITIAALFVVGNLARIKAGNADPGLTTEMAGALMYGLGAYIVVGEPMVAVVCAGIVAVLLQWKQPLHHFVARIGEPDIKAIMQFVLITLVIFPVLPNRTYGPFDVLNPFKIWLMVVLIIAISLVGYVLHKIYGERAGAVCSGILGGIISSAAATVTFARRSQHNAGSELLATLMIMLATATVYVRVLIEVATVAPADFTHLAPPLVVMLVLCAAISAATYWRARNFPANLPEQDNPAALKSALVFGALYAIVLLAVAFTKHNFGAGGLYVVASICGLTDMNAITLTTAQLVDDGRLLLDTGWRLILVASLANLIFKAGIVLVLGAPRLFKDVAICFGLVFVGGVMVLWLWPW